MRCFVRWFYGNAQLIITCPCVIQVPILLDRLHELKAQQQKENLSKSPAKGKLGSNIDLTRPFANIGKSRDSSGPREAPDNQQETTQDPSPTPNGGGGDQNSISPSTSQDSSREKSGSPPLKRVKRDRDKSEPRKNSKAKKTSQETANPYRMTSKIHMNKQKEEGRKDKQGNIMARCFSDRLVKVIDQFLSQNGKKKTFVFV